MHKTHLTLLLAAVFALVPAFDGNTCTNVIVTKGASKDGSTLVTYAADSHYLFGELYYHPAADWKPGSLLKVYEWDTNKYLGEIDQVPHTYQTVGNMNEKQVIITETTWGGREELMDRRGRIDYGSLIYIALQRASTAREAIHASEGETLSIADKNEAWIMEIIGKGTRIRNGVNADKGVVWVALRVPDGAICAHANQARIGAFPLKDPDNCMYAKDVISFARNRGYFEGADEEFSFKKAYGPADFGTVRGCDARVWSAFNILSGGWFSYYDVNGNAVTKDASDFLDYAMGYNLDGDLPLFIYPREKVSVKALADVMRDHFEGTPMDMTQDIGAGGNALPYRWRPMEYKVEDKTYLNERAIATQQTGFWMVGQARDYVPDEVGGILWFGTDDAATSYVTPIYTSTSKVPECFREGNGDLLHYSPTASFPARPQDGRCVRNRPDGAQDALGGQRRRGPVQRGGGEAPGQDVVQPDLDGLAQAFREGDEIRHGLHGKDGAGPVRSLGGPGGRTPCQVHRRQREAAGRGGQIQALRVLREAAREGRMAGLHRTLERNCCPRGRRCFEG